MACIRLQRTGSCSHYQCPFSDETLHGYECVDLLRSKDGRLVCEVGCECLEKCPYFVPKVHELATWRPPSDLPYSQRSDNQK
jgi:hypothetical protein